MKPEPEEEPSTTWPKLWARTVTLTATTLSTFCWYTWAGVR